MGLLTLLAAAGVYSLLNEDLLFDWLETRLYENFEAMAKAQGEWDAAKGAAEGVAGGDDDMNGPGR